MKILFMGSSGPLSLIPLQAIMQTEHSVCAVALEMDQANSFYNHLFPVTVAKESINKLHLDSFAQQNELPVIVLNKNLEAHIDEIKKYQPDIILVSCFGLRLPESILEIPHFICMNIHPSLLPAFRGPHPIFWQMKAGVTNMGVSLHRMNAQLDDGDIIQQMSVELYDGMSQQQIKIMLAKLAAKLIKDVLVDAPAAIQNAQSQDKSVSRYDSYPLKSDFHIDDSWSARTLYNFICAYQNDQRCFPYTINNEIFNVIEAYSYQEVQRHDFLLEHDQVCLSCVDGSVKARIKLI